MAVEVHVVAVVVMLSGSGETILGGGMNSAKITGVEGLEVWSIMTGSNVLAWLMQKLDDRIYPPFQKNALRHYLPK